ncbi:hypothetical protein CERZMDRAFT_106454 [Cercospora zeae-maydis SCOH1-5]|uniref:Uncharacterized protein n=1 Tax=Cercospora zeae-maydis SCOH1-5 TaxID=717836 RepID=A0A6A6FDY1_9PEZI|nr:hypothetical protein CERZMDRAFT_106454 [Cercospora zeae-maydis SCOH1-5]
MATSSASPNYNTTTDDEAFGELETALRRQIKDTLHGVATSHDKLTSSYEQLDNRVQILEQRLPKNLRFRLKTIEDHVKFQETINSNHPGGRAGSNLDTATLSTKLKALEDINNALTGKLSLVQLQLDQHKRNLDRIGTPNTTLHESDPVVQTLLSRLHRLESQGDSKLLFEACSTDEIAEEMIRRLTEEEGGISPNLNARLHALTAGMSSAATEKTDGADRRHSSASSHVPHKPHKRSAPTATESSSRSEPSSTPDSSLEEPPPKRTRRTASASATAVRASPRKISSIFKTTKTCLQNGAGGEIDLAELALLQDEPRRSGRKPKPARKPQFWSWLEVKAAKQREGLM